MDILCAKKDFFKNPQKLPLNELCFEFKNSVRTEQNTHTLEEVDLMLNQPMQFRQLNKCFKTDTNAKPALDKCWTDAKTYCKFEPFLLHLDENVNRNFLNNTKFLEYLRFLVECTYHQFWCYIACDSGVSVMMKDFLQHSIPIHIISHLNKDYLNLYNELYDCVCRIYHRLLHFNLSELEYITTDAARNIVQQTGLFNTEIVFKLCYLYNYKDPKFIKRVIDFCLTTKTNTFSNVENVLSRFMGQLEELIHNTLHRRVLPEKLFLLFEITSGLAQFLSVYEHAVEIGLNMDIPINIMYVYQKFCSETMDIMEKESYTNQKLSFHKWFAFCKFEMINLFHIFTTHCINLIVSLRNDHAKQDAIIEIYVGLISNALDHELFVIAYNKTYPLRLQFETLVDCVANFDLQQTNYLLQSLDAIIADSTPKPKETKQFSLPLIIKHSESEQVHLEQCDSIYKVLSQHLDKQRNKKSTVLPKSVSLALEQYYELTKQLNISNSLPTYTNKQSKEGTDYDIKSVLDVLPHLGAGFVTKCLEKFNHDPNEVITRVLNNDLPGDLLNIPIDLPRSMLALDMPGTSQQPIMYEHIGKKENYTSMNQLLNDKKEKEQIKQLVLKASYAFDLEDEYDDRYEMGNLMNDSDNESRIYRHLGKDEESEESESSSEEEKVERNKTGDFCTDPAVLREIRAQQYKNKKYVVRQNKDTTEQSNDKKKVHKSTKPAHNKKVNAQWKRNKGMIPS